MSNLDNKENIDAFDLGLGAKTPSSNDDKENVSVKKAEAAMQNAAASAALKAAIDANSEIASKEAEKSYILEKRKFMLNKCKDDDVVEFTGNKIFANYFGKVYTFLYNTIPVTIRFDGTKQKFPRFIYDRIVEKIDEVSDSNTNVVDIEDRTTTITNK